MTYKGFILIIALLTSVGAGAADGPFPKDMKPILSPVKSGSDQIDLSYVGSCMWRGVSDAVVKDSYAYLAMNAGLKIIDISNPSVPVEVSKLHLELMWDWDVEVEGDYAYLVDYYGLKIINISNPADPSLVSRCDTPEHTAYDVALAGDYAVVALRSNGIILIDISNPYYPHLAGSYDPPGDARNVEVRDNLVYVASHNGGLQIVDITDPNAPDSVGALDGIGYAQEVALKDNVAYLACLSYGMQAVNIADPAHPALLNTYPAAHNFSQIKIKDTVAYVAGDIEGAIAINIANPLALSLMGSIEVIGKITTAEPFVFVTDYYNELTLLNFDNPASPAIEGVFATPGFGRQFAVRDNLVYSVSSSGLSVIDITNPQEPYLKGLAGDIIGYDLEVVDTIAYVSNTDSVLRIVSIADPQAPYLIDTVQSVGYCYNVVSDGQYAYLTTWQDGLVVVNVANPQAAFIAAKYMEWGRSGYMEMVGDFLFQEDVLILDVTDRLNPSVVGNYQGYGNTGDAAIVDTLVYLASGDSELMYGWLKIVNIAAPEIPVEVGTFTITNECLGVASDGNVACVTDYASLQVLDVSDPTTPTLLAGTGGPGFTGVEMDGSYIYVAGGYGFMIYQMATVCGDANDDGTINVGDPVYIIKYVFAGGPAPSWICKADANGDGMVNVGDAVLLIGYIFRGGVPPVEDCCL